MDRHTFACYGLIVSALMLAALLFVNLPQQMAQQAHGEMVLHKETFTLMTAKSRPGEEALFVMDSVNERLLVYNVNIGRKRIELAAALDLSQIFGGVGTKPGTIRPGARQSR